MKKTLTKEDARVHELQAHCEYYAKIIERLTNEGIIPSAMGNIPQESEDLTRFVVGTALEI